MQTTANAKNNLKKNLYSLMAPGSSSICHIPLISLLHNTLIQLCCSSSFFFAHSSFLFPSAPTAVICTNKNSFYSFSSIWLHLMQTLGSHMGWRMCFLIKARTPGHALQKKTTKNPITLLWGNMLNGCLYPGKSQSCVCVCKPWLYARALSLGGKRGSSRQK